MNLIKLPQFLAVPDFCVNKKMKFKHHQLEFEIYDEWLTEANVIDFTPPQYCYRHNLQAVGESNVFPVLIERVAPLLERAIIKGIFCNSQETGENAKHRVMRILNWLRENKPIEPVKVVSVKNGVFEYKLVDGCHRFYCALALGFKAVPATFGFDIRDPNG